MAAPPRWHVRHAVIIADEGPALMGIVNVTPDSFSDGAQHHDAGAAVAHGYRLWSEGAAIVDVGGESTRPGAESVPAPVELARALPVVEGLVGRGVAVSIDTSKSVVARAALEKGAVAVNDVTALGDPDMAGVVAEHEAGLVLMHMRGEPGTMQDDPRYDDVVGEVRDYLLKRAAIAEAAGIDPARICLDPGIGFGKTLAHNLELLRRLPELVATGFPVLVGASRKSFLGRVLGDLDGAARDDATAVVTGWCAAAGVAVVRVHDVARSSRAGRLVAAIVRPRSGSEE